MNPHHHNQQGFSLIEMLVAATIFTFVVTSVSGLFIQALDLQRRASGIQKIEENVQFVTESITREVRVSKITSGNTTCAPMDSVATATLVIDHPVNGTVTYRYDKTGPVGVILRNGQPITSADVDFARFAFCVRGASATADGEQARLTMPMTVQSILGRPSTRVSVSTQTSIISRDFSIQ